MKCCQLQRYGPPPSYPHLKIPGLNAPIPPGAKFGYQPGGWGKPPVDEVSFPFHLLIFFVPFFVSHGSYVLCLTNFRTDMKSSVLQILISLDALFTEMFLEFSSKSSLITRYCIIISFLFQIARLFLSLE